MVHDRVVNFSAGPGMLPLAVLERVQKDMLCYPGSGQSVMEMSHRSNEYLNIYNQAEKDLRDILGIPTHYKVLNLQGGATLQFSAIPLNLLAKKSGCIYSVTGQWSEKAAVEAKKFGQPTVVFDGKSEKYTRAPSDSELHMPSSLDTAEYFYYCDNETVNGVEFGHVPNVNLPLVCDMSSNFMSRHVDFSKFAVVYAGAQKNLGPAGNTVVILDPKCVDGSKEQSKLMPTYCSWKIANDAGSMYNTPGCFAIYVMGEYLKYTKSHGGVQFWEKESDRKSSLLYGAIDNSDGFYSAPVKKGSRSRMNVPFQVKGGNETLEKKFITEATKAGLVNLAGHRSVGGLRASLYNGVPYEGVEKLVAFMDKFKDQNEHSQSNM